MPAGRVFVRYTQVTQNSKGGAASGLAALHAAWLCLLPPGDLLRVRLVKADRRAGSTRSTTAATQAWLNSLIKA